MIWASCVYMIMYVPVDEQEFLGGGIWSWHNVRERYERCMFSAALAGRLTMAPVAFARVIPPVRLLVWTVPMIATSFH